MPRFVTVTLNPALDSTFLVPNFSAGEVNCATNPSEMTAGGKGINVARVLNTLCGSGDEVIALGCAGGEAGRQLRRLLDAEKLTHAFMDVSPVETRQALIIADTGDCRQTVVNEPGALLAQADLFNFKSLLASTISKGDNVLFCGSLPPGFPAATYADLIEEARLRGAATVLLDSSGEPLAEGARLRPNVLKVNQTEFADLIKSWRISKPTHFSEAKDAFGVDILTVTQGAMGARMAFGDSGVWQARMPRLDVLSAVGSGDAFTAGLIYALAQAPGDPSSALRLASACGGANALSIGAGRCSREQIETLSGKIEIECIA